MTSPRHHKADTSRALDTDGESVGTLRALPSATTERWGETRGCVRQNKPIYGLMAPPEDISGRGSRGRGVAGDMKGDPKGGFAIQAEHACPLALQGGGGMWVESSEMRPLHCLSPAAGGYVLFVGCSRR